MFLSASVRAQLSRALPFFASILLTFSAALCPAAAIHGVVTDPSGARIAGAKVVAVCNGKAVGNAVSGSDGNYQLTTGVEGRFFLVISASSFRQLETPDFYAGRVDTVERNLVLEPAWVRESIVVTANGSPTPQAQTSESTNVLETLDLVQHSDLVDALRLMPGTVVSQEGQMGAQASLFVRGGNSTANKVLLDGIDAGDLGGQFDFGPLSTTAVERVEVFRGANSSLYGADAGSSVISLRTPHGTTSFPSLLAQFDGGNFSTTHEEATGAGTYNRLDYLGAFSWQQTGNALPNDEFHVATTATNLGYQVNATTQLRATLHYGVSSTGSPNAWDFYRIADSATQKDQDLLISASVDNQTTENLHNTLRYGATRKREQYNQWAQVGLIDAYGDSTGQKVTITGANGYSVTGSALLDYGGTYPWGYQLVNNRDQLVYQGDYRFTPHLAGLIGFHYQDERGVENDPTYYTYYSTERTDYNYLAAVHGDFSQRFFYNLGGNLEHNSLFGTQTTPRAGVTFYAFKPAKKIFSGTRLRFNYGDGVREPKLTDETGSLYRLLANANLTGLAAQAKIGPLTAPTTRSYEGGLEQGFFRDRLNFRMNLFHNQFGREIESVGGKMLVNMLTGLSAAQLKQLETALGYYYTYDYGLYVNTQAFRAQGVEATVESGLGSNLFLRGGYTYTDSVVQRSFTSDNEALLGGYPTTFNGIPVGWITPLKGARPFRRPPHTGFFTATYSAKKISGVLAASLASSSDDSTFLYDPNYGSSLVLPNRNLDHGYAKLDLGGNYQWKSWMSSYLQMENILSNQHIAPIGYVSLPFTVRTGIKLALGKGR